MNPHEKLELQISKFLRVGIVLSGTLIAFGWASMLSWRGNPFVAFDTYDKIPLRDLLNFYYVNENWGVLTMYLGLFILISLPIIRVLLTGILFIRQKDKILAATAFFVFLVLTLSFFLGIQL